MLKKMKKIIVGISGATGSILARKLIDYLTKIECHVELVMTKPACMTAAYELEDKPKTSKHFTDFLPEEQRKRITRHSIDAIGSTIASGSYKTDGMAIVPCSIATIGALACGLADNLLRRSADVCLKEKRPLVLAVREAPLSNIHLENMLRLSQAGAIISPPVPAWYNKPKTLDEVENHLVGKILSSLNISNDLEKEWQG